MRLALPSNKSRPCHTWPINLNVAAVSNGVLTERRAHVPFDARYALITNYYYYSLAREIITVSALENDASHAYVTFFSDATRNIRGVDYADLLRSRRRRKSSRASGTRQSRRALSLSHFSLSAKRFPMIIPVVTVGDM